MIRATRTFPEPRMWPLTKCGAVPSRETTRSRLSNPSSTSRPLSRPQSSAPATIRLCSRRHAAPGIGSVLRHHNRTNSCRPGKVGQAAHQAARHNLAVSMRPALHADARVPVASMSRRRITLDTTTAALTDTLRQLPSAFACEDQDSRMYRKFCSFLRHAEPRVRRNVVWGRGRCRTNDAVAIVVVPLATHTDHCLSAHETQ